MCFKTLASKKATLWALKKSQSNDKLLQKNNDFQLKRNKKHSLKQVISITCTLEKKFSVAATFEGF